MSMVGPVRDRTNYGSRNNGTMTTNIGLPFPSPECGSLGSPSGARSEEGHSGEVLVARAASMVPKEAKMTSPPREGQRGSRAGASGLGLC